MNEETPNPALEDAISEVIKTEPGTIKRVGMGTIKRIADKFIDNKIHTFPALCQETRRINHLKLAAFRGDGNAGGWSDDKQFKFDYTIPSELYMFMVNMVCAEFWNEGHQKVWRSFMKAILRGDDAMDLLKKVKLHYDGLNDKIKFK